MKNYIWAVVAIVFVALLSAVCILVFRPDADVAIVLSILIGFVTTTIASVFSAMKSKEASFQAQAANTQAQETHLLVNSRMEQAIKDATKAAYGEGMKDGREAADDRTDMLANKPDGSPVTNPGSVTPARSQ